MDKLREVAPEPVTSLPGVPLPLPHSNSLHPWLTGTITTLHSIQKYSTIPFSFFTVVHLSSVVIAPALFGPDVGNSMIMTGRELYQIPWIEVGLLVSTAAHVISGIALNGLRKYYNYVKYGTINPIHKNRNMRNSSKGSSQIIVDKEDEKVTDVNEGLGGITSLLGLGPRTSLSYKWFGVSPLSFSGYIFLILVSGHVLKERINPLLVDGDSSLIDLSYVATGLQSSFGKIFTGLNVLVGVGSYHVIVGWNRYLRQFSLRARKRAYLLIFGILLCSVISLLKINNIEVYPTVARKFQIYANYI